MWKTLTLHRNKLILLIGLLLSSISASIWFGDVKSFSHIDWLDVIGEGGSAVALAVWVILILGSRPAGRVTDLLALGLGFMFLALWQDALDEFIYLPNSQWWDQWLENISMPMGIGLLTYGLFHWHSEQLAINEQLRKRERIFREHRMLDRLTQIGKVDYLNKQIEDFCRLQPSDSLSVLMIDVDNFSDINRLYGHREGDRLLNEISEVLLLNLRDSDLICRYGGDHFAVLLPHTPMAKTRLIEQELKQAIQFFAFKLRPQGITCYQTISIGAACVHRAGDSNAESMIAEANKNLTLNRLNQSGKSA